VKFWESKNKRSAAARNKIFKDYDPNAAEKTVAPSDRPTRYARATFGSPSFILPVRYPWRSTVA